jgi:hypothetical protein
MKKTQTSKKLSLGKNTVRVLASADLGEVAGGGTTEPPTETCTPGSRRCTVLYTNC